MDLALLSSDARFLPLLGGTTEARDEEQVLTTFTLGTGFSVQRMYAEGFAIAPSVSSTATGVVLLQALVEQAFEEIQEAQVPPRTNLVRRLLALRKSAIAKGTPLLTQDEINAEVARRRYRP